MFVFESAIFNIDNCRDVFAVFGSSKADYG